MKYTGYDHTATAKKAGTERFVELMRKHYGFKNLGTLVVRPMRNGKGMSVHATGRAMDLGFDKDVHDMPEGKHREIAVAVMKWLVANYVALGVEEVHDYKGLTKKGTEQWGRAWRCSRTGGKPGWKDWTETDNGQPGGFWIHVELSPAMADDDTAVELAFRKLPKAI